MCPKIDKFQVINQGHIARNRSTSPLEPPNPNYNWKNRYFYAFMKLLSLE